MSLILVDGLKDRPGTGGPKFPNGLHLPAGIGITGDGHINMAGVCTFSGNVTIGGTLTYEDVTNIDSVGVVTARSGVNVSGGEFKVGTAITVGSAGVSTFSGNVNLNGVSSFAGGVGIADSIFHTGDTNTAIRFSDADTIQFETGGSQRVRVSAAGSFGIGNLSSGLDCELVVKGAAHTAFKVKSANEGTRAFIQTVQDSDIRIGSETAHPVSFYQGGNQRMQIDTSGRLLLGTTTEGYVSADDLTVATSGNTGITIRSGTGSLGTLAFSDATSGAAEYDGYIQYSQTDQNMMFGTGGGNEALRIQSTGKIANDGKSASTYGSPDLLIAGVGTAHNIVCMSNDSNTTDCASIGFRVAGESGGDYTKVGIFAQRTATDQGWNNLDLVFAHNTVANSGQVMVADEKFRFKSTGEMLIDSSSNQMQPGAPLNVISDKNVETGVDDMANYHLVLKNPQNDDGEAVGLAFGITDTAAKVGAAIIHERDSSGSQGSMKFYTRPDNSGPPAENFRIDSAGRCIVGGGTHAGGSALVVKGGNQNTYSTIGMFGSQTNPASGQLVAQLRMGANTSATSADIRVYTADQWASSDYPSNMRFYTTADGGGSGTETFRIGRSGSHAYGQLNCTSTVQSAVFSVSSNGTTVFGSKVGATNTQTHIAFENPNGGVGNITTNASATAYNTSSDYRLKENAVSITDGIERLKTLKPYRFNFKKDPSTTGDGFFAHEVTAVPEAVSGEKDGEKMQGMDYGRITPLLTAALQEAIAEIETLKAKVASLESN